MRGVLKSLLFCANVLNNFLIPFGFRLTNLVYLLKSFERKGGIVKKYNGLTKRGQADEFLGRRGSATQANRGLAVWRKYFCNELRDFL